MNSIGRQVRILLLLYITSLCCFLIFGVGRNFGLPKGPSLEPFIWVVLFVAISFISMFLVYQMGVLLSVSKKDYDKQRAMSSQKEIHSDLSESVIKADRVERYKKYISLVGHEFKGPINVISGISQIMADDPRLDEDLLDMAQRITKNSRVLAKMVNDYFQMEKIEKGILLPRLEKVPVSVALERVTSRVRGESYASGIKIFFDKKIKSSKVLETDPNYFEKILVKSCEHLVKRFPGQAIQIQSEDKTSSEIHLQIFIKGSNLEGQSERIEMPEVGLMLAESMAAHIGGNLELHQFEQNGGLIFSFSINKIKRSKPEFGSQLSTVS